MKSTARANQIRWAFTLVELLIVIVCLGIVALMLLPALARPKRAAPGYECRNNLKQVGVSFRVWAIDNGEKYPMGVSVTNGGTMELIDSGVVFTHFQVMSNELSTPRILVCPQDPVSEKRMATAFSRSSSAHPNFPFASDTNVSYFVGVDADQTQPAMFLTGDANVILRGQIPKGGLQAFRPDDKLMWDGPRHVNRGNVGMADGSVVEQFDTAGLQKALTASGVTNRLAIPASP